MTHDQARKRIATLTSEIRRHDHLYYVSARPAISDEVYDDLMRELVRLEGDHPDLVTADSPTQRVAGTPQSELGKVEHVAPMRSLDGTREESEIRDFDGRVRKGLGREDVVYVGEPKFDGISIELVYKDGNLVTGSTRGDGLIGEEVTQNLRTMRSIPLRLGAAGVPASLAVRGEALMHLKGFHELNARLTAEGKEVYANPRNATSGAIRQLDARITASRPLVFYAFEIVGAEEHGLHTESACLQALAAWGFLVDASIVTGALDEMIRYHGEICRTRDDLPYEVDGIVIKVDAIGDHATLGTRTRSPRWAVAFKFEPRQEVTLVERIAVQVGRTGKLTPVALLRPVNVGGVTVSRATLHNQDEVRRKDVRAGDTVRVRRAGDVIPDVAEVLLERRPPGTIPFEMPTSCPVCGGAIVAEGAYHMCTGGLDCSAQRRGLLEHYGSRAALDIEGLGEKTVATFLETGLVTEPADLYRLKLADLLRLERFAEKSAHNLLEAIERSRTPPLDRLLFGLGIPLVGRHVARVLATAFGELGRIMSATEEELLAIHEIGPEVAHAVTCYFNTPRSRDHIERLLAAGVTPVWTRPAVAQASALAGKKLVFTGTLEQMTRDDAKRIAEENGARVTGSVSKTTDILIAGADAGSKLEKAKQLGVQVLSETDFLALAGRP